MIRNQFYINGKKLADPIISFTPEDLFFKPPDEQKKLDDIMFIQSSLTVSKDGYFCSYITTTSTLHKLNKPIHVFIRQSLSLTMLSLLIKLLSQMLTWANNDKEYGAG